MGSRGNSRRALVAALAAMSLVWALAGPAEAYPRPGRTERLAVGSWAPAFPPPAVAPKRPAVSPDGRYVAFGSVASDLVPEDTNDVEDVFVLDRKTRQVERVSVGIDGAEAGATSELPAISADGRHVAFLSWASNLVPGDTNERVDVFVHDRATRITERVSIGTEGSESNGLTDLPALSADGRLVAFQSTGGDLVSGDTNFAPDVFVHDRETNQTERVSVSTEGAEANAAAQSAALSADGRFVAFWSAASNLVPDDTNGAWDIFVHDRDGGTTERVSVSTSGREADGGSSNPDISADGLVVVFQSTASNLVPADGNGQASDIFVHDRATGTTERVSVDSAGIESGQGVPFGLAGAEWSIHPAVGADGRHVLFDSFASNLVPGDTNDAWDVFLHDRATGVTERVSVADDGSEGVGGPTVGSGYRRHAITGDGTEVIFKDTASNLVPGDANGQTDVFVRTRGPSVGVGGLSALREGARLDVSGWATFGGREIAATEDPPDDGTAEAGRVGAELTGATAIHRPEQEDILFELRVTSLPEPSSNVPMTTVGAHLGGLPAVVYGASFTVGDDRYEVRALRAAAVATPPGAPHFALYRCLTICLEEARLSGGIGTTGDEVRIGVPLSALAMNEGALTDVRAFAALGEAASGGLVTLDEAPLPDAMVEAPRVLLGIAPAGAPEHEVAFDTEATIVAGSFSGTVEPSPGVSGNSEIWGRACIGQACGAAARTVTP
jgi:Tol biopolymer transport system component